MLRVLVTISILSCSFLSWGTSWEKALQTKTAELEVQWIASEPFIFENSEGEIVGIEYEIMNLFCDYAKQRHQVDINLNWVVQPTFGGILDDIAVETRDDVISAAAFSINDERKKHVRFTVPYLSDITVLVSSKGSPIVHTYEEIDDLMKNMRAVSIKQTIYEDLLVDLKKQLDIEFETLYLDTDEEILSFIQNNPNHFGFIDLPIYLILVKNGGELTRQNFFTSKGQGYGFLMPLESDWHIPLDFFLMDREYQAKIKKIIAKYMSPELFRFINEVYNDEQISTSILTVEKELQLALLKNANLELEQEKASKRGLILTIVFMSFFGVVIGILYYENRKATKMLVHQKEKIEEHEKDISEINEQLINRNKQLFDINEEKNNLIQILAHDLRSPLSQIISPADILLEHGENLNQEDKMLLGQIGNGARRINKMITKILDVEAIDQNRKLILKETVDINILLKDLKTAYNEYAYNKSISLEFTCQEKITVETDKLLLYLILENLISNAIKFSPKSSIVKVLASLKDSHVNFQVQDQGPGFSDEDKSKLFQSFQKLSAKPTNGEESTGLGLSIVKKYVSEIGGEVWLESDQANGSSFFISIPI